MTDKLELRFSSASSKLDGIPKIIYRNHESDTEKRDYMEEQFEMWNVTDYGRYSKEYSEDNYDDWKDLILDDGLIQSPSELARTLNVIKPIIDWYDSESSETCIFMEDVVDFSMVHKWLFDWKFLDYHLPYNWDCIQMFVSSKKFIRMHLHPWVSSNGSYYAFMVTRTFAKRLKHYHYVDGKYKLGYPSSNKSILSIDRGSIDTFFYDIGITYSLPIFCLNNNLIPKIDNDTVRDHIGSDAIRYWWSNKGSKFSNFELFHYNKGDNEWKMEVQFDVESKKPEVYMDATEAIMIWI